MTEALACALCGSQELETLYRGPIRIGRFGNVTKEPVVVWKCTGCLAGFLPATLGQSADYYQSDEYRREVDAGAEVNDYFRLHDGEQAGNLGMTGTTGLRDKVVADVGAGAGSFLDTIKGFAKRAIAIEPSHRFRESLTERGYASYPFAADAARDWARGVDLVTTFSVVEHVENPLAFLVDLRALLAPGGRLVMSTPNTRDALLEALPEDYSRFFFRKAHLWYFDRESLTGLLERAGFDNMRVVARQRFGLSNFLGWLKDRAPSGNQRQGYVSETADAVWKAELERTNRADYLYAEASVPA
jgi:SAM-dependent methyltransferase